MSRILRYFVPMDGQAHYVDLSGPVVHVASRQPDTVEFWTVDTDRSTVSREFVVVATGHLYPGHWRHVGTALAADGALVWHLMEVPRG